MTFNNHFGAILTSHFDNFLFCLRCLIFGGHVKFAKILSFILNDDFIYPNKNGCITYLTD